MLLKVDLNSSDVALGLEIATQCAKFGVVKAVKLHRSPKRFVLVEMATEDQAFNLAETFKRTSFGSCVLLHLEQEHDETNAMLRTAH